MPLWGEGGIPIASCVRAAIIMNKGGGGFDPVNPVSYSKQKGPW
jgi:hypothetical protein